MSTPAVDFPIADDSAFDLEFRCDDDAWYTAAVLVDGDTLTVKLQDFPQTKYDEVFNSRDFATPEALDEFRLRFRSLSQQLEDSECSRVVEGTAICATYKGDGQVRFFDAVVEAVKPAEHAPDKCTCTFILYWQQGPEEGNVMSTDIADICLLSHGILNSRVDDFINHSKEKIRAAPQRSKSVSSEISLRRGLALGTQSDQDKDMGGGHYELRPNGSPQRSKSVSSEISLRRGLALGTQSDQDKDVGGGHYELRPNGSLLSTGRGRKYCQQSDQEKDVGGGKETGDHHYIIVDNLEKDLSPSSIMEFIHKQPSLTPQAYVFPSLSSETYARGAIVVDCKTKLMRIYEFLNNPSHFIVSSTGRPWVIAESMPRTGTFKMTFGSLLPTSQYNFQKKHIDSKLKVVCLGTEGYTRATILRGLFNEFNNHLNGLQKRLAVEEKRLLHPSNAV